MGDIDENVDEFRVEETLNFQQLKSSTLTHSIVTNQQKRMKNSDSNEEHDTGSPQKHSSGKLTPLPGPPSKASFNNEQTY